MAATLTTAIDTNLAAESFFGAGNQTAWNSFYPWLNAGNTLGNAMSGQTLNSTFLTATDSQALPTSAITDVTGLNVSFVVPNGAFEVRCFLGAILYSAVGTFTTLFLKDNAGTPALYYGASYTASTAGPVVPLQCVLPIDAGTYTPGTTVNFKASIQTGATGVATVYTGTLVYKVQTNIRAVAA